MGNYVKRGEKYLPAFRRVYPHVFAEEWAKKNLYKAEPEDVKDMSHDLLKKMADDPVRGPWKGIACKISANSAWLRLWSTAAAKCVLVCDLLSFVPGDTDFSSAPKPIMKKLCGSSSSPST